MASDELLASVLDLLPVGVWVAHAPCGELALANRTFREIMGIEARADVAVGSYGEPYGICDRAGAPYPEAQMPFVRALQARATVTVDDIVIHRHDGGRVAVRAIARPVFAADVITHVVIAFADISEEVAAREAQQHSEERLRRAQRLESIGNLAAGIAHDFNNLLTSIQVLASMLGRDEPDPRRLDDLRHIQDATERAATLTRGLLAFGRRGAGAMTRVALDDLTTSMVELCRRTFDRRIAITLRDAGGAARVDGDPGELEQVVMNLLVNARDAMPEGGALTVQVVADGSRVRLIVEDTGPGVPVALRERIFEPYFTTHGAGVGTGSGVGLATVWAIVQRHGGTIDVDAARGGGARFTIDLPASPAPADAPAPAAPTPPLRPGHGRILLIDDDAEVRAVTARVLASLGYQVVEAADGADGVALFAAEPARFAAVMLDVIMPRMGGREALTALRLLRDVPVVVTSGVVSAADADAWIAAGAHALLPKPYDLHELSTVLAAVTGSG